MNQILSVDNNIKERGRTNKTIGVSSTPGDIKSILKFFAIAILVFGIVMIGSGSYSMYKNANGDGGKTKPVIEVNPMGEDEISLKVTHKKELSKVTYEWNEEGPVQVPCEGKKQVETLIEIPGGTNTLKVYAVDVNGQEIEYQRLYTIEGGIEIDLEAQGNNIVITATSDKTLLYMTYRWDEEDETQVDINDYSIEQKVAIPKGLHKLTVIVVDEDNKTQTKEQEIHGVTKPEVDVTTDGSSNFIINASDDQGIKKVEFSINGEEFVLNLNEVLSLEQRKEFEYSYPLQDGRNDITVTVYNENDVSETFEGFLNK